MTYFKNKNVLVTGGAGLVGSSLIPALVGEGAKVRATVHQRKPRDAKPEVEYLSLDLTKPENCRTATAGMHYVFHCAAHTTGAMDVATTPMAHVTPNVVMNSWLLEAAYQAGIEKFLWMSSTTGYPVSDQPMKEEDMFVGEPFEKYYFAGHMKRFTEILCRMYGEKLQRRMTTIVLRPTNIYGPGDKFEFERSHVSAALLRRVVERHDPIEVWGTGDDVRDLIYVDDFVEATLLASEKLDSYAVLNIGLGKGYTVKQILRVLLELENYEDAKVVFDPSKPTMIPTRLVDVSNAEATLGFRARTNLREGLRKTIDWYKGFRSGQHLLA